MKDLFDDAPAQNSVPPVKDNGLTRRYGLLLFPEDQPQPLPLRKHPARRWFLPVTDLRLRFPGEPILKKIQVCGYQTPGL